MNSFTTNNRDTKHLMALHGDLLYELEVGFGSGLVTPEFSSR
jgi:hypothetical protein